MMSIAIIGTIVGIIVGLIAIGTFVFKVFSKLNVLTEGVMGKKAVTDFAGEVVEPAIPSLQARVSKIEQLVISTHDHNERLTVLEEAWKTHLDRHDRQQD